MSANSHAPNPRGVLCNAGAGAAAGTSICLVSEKIEEKEKKKKYYTKFDFFYLWEIWICCINLFISFLGAGVIAATFVCPLDVIKTRFQVHGRAQLTNGDVKGISFYLAFWGITFLLLLLLMNFIIINWFFFILGSLIVGSLQQIFQKEGLRGMYRGLSPTVLALLPNWAVSLLPSSSDICIIVKLCDPIQFSSWCIEQGKHSSLYMCFSLQYNVLKFVIK